MKQTHSQQHYTTQKVRHLSNGDCKLCMTTGAVENFITRHPAVGLANTTFKRQPIGFLPQTVLIPVDVNVTHNYTATSNLSCTNYTYNVITSCYSNASVRLHCHNAAPCQMTCSTSTAGHVRVCPPKVPLSVGGS